MNYARRVLRCGGSKHAFIYFRIAEHNRFTSHHEMPGGGVRLIVNHEAGRIPLGKALFANRPPRL